MLEIFGIIMLCNKNKENAIARGRKPGGFVGLTVGLWLGLEFIGALIGFSLGLETGAYLLAIVFAIIGGVISYVAAKNCRPGQYVPPAVTMTQQIAQNAQPLAQPCRIDIIRESSMVGALVSWTFTLNGQNVGSLGNGQFITTYTNQQQNILRATDAYGTEIAPYVFSAISGGYTEVHFKTNKFVSGGAPAPQPQYVAVPEVKSQSPAFCHICGAPLTQGAMFCIKCGTACAPMTQNAPVSQGAPVQQSAPIAYNAPAPAMPQMQPKLHIVNPMRALWTALILLGGWLLLLLCLGIFDRHIVFNSTTAYLFTSVLLGIGVYLLIQRELKFKLYAAGLLLLQVLMVTTNQTAVAVSTLRLGALDDVFMNYRFWPGFMYALIPVAFIAGMTLLFSRIWSGKAEKRRNSGIGWIAAGTGLVANIIIMLINQARYVSMGMIEPEIIVVNVLDIFFDAAVLGLVVMLAAGISRQEKSRLRLSAWPIVWCTLCIIGLLSTFISTIAAESLTPTLMILLLASLTGYILLLCGKRAGFFTTLLATSMYLVGTFQTGLQYTLYGAPNQAIILFASIIGAANPIITWFSIRRAWREEGIQPAMYRPVWPQQKNVKTFSKVAAIISLVIGALFLLFPLPFIIVQGFDDSMLVCILPGAVVTVFSIFGVVSLFGKKSVYHRWLDILMQVLFWVLCGSLLLIIIIGVLSSLSH